MNDATSRVAASAGGGMHLVMLHVSGVNFAWPANTPLIEYAGEPYDTAEGQRRAFELRHIPRRRVPTAGLPDRCTPVLYAAAVSPTSPAAFAGAAPASADAAATDAAIAAAPAAAPVTSPTTTSAPAAST
jgi:nucleoid-associated protein YgaU